MRLFSLLHLMLSAANCIAQRADMRLGLPIWGTGPISLHYLPDRQGEHLPTTGYIRPPVFRSWSERPK